MHQSPGLSVGLYLKLLLLSAFQIILPAQNFAQPKGFDFGKIGLGEFNYIPVGRDTSAAAIVLQETGNAYFETESTYDLIVTYHVRIKILKSAGLGKSNIEIPLRRNEKNYEKIESVKASSFNLTSTGIRESKLSDRSIYDEDRGKFYSLKKFAIPDVQVGSIIEYEYVLRTPFIFNLYTWEFQSDIPKLKSEYWAKIPGNYIYNIALRGPFKLEKNESSIEKKCVVVFQGGYENSTHADCILYKFAMSNIPAFVEEDYMTAKSNFLSAINFELSEIRHFTGVVDKITKEWKDIDQELKLDKNFGLQLKRGVTFMEDKIKPYKDAGTDSLSIAKSIYDYIKFHFIWNEVFGKYTEFGIKEAFEAKRGNVADINLSLVAALKSAGFVADPLILSTRNNGLPTKIYPVISDFNYVVAKLSVGGKVILLDATDDFMPFGLLPERCYNDQGRVIGDKGSAWLDLKPTDKYRKVSFFDFKLMSNGEMQGSGKRTYFGYHAVLKRKQSAELKTEEEQIDRIGKELMIDASLHELKINHEGDVTKPYEEEFKLTVENPAQANFSTLSINPFVTRIISENPFKSPERFYPVDFGVPIEDNYFLSIELPEGIKPAFVPEKIALVLPGNSGRFLYNIQYSNNKLVVSANFSISKTVFGAEEYHSLRELYTRVLQAQSIDLILTR